MVVVSDSSPLNVLVRIELADILPRLFGEIYIPERVAAELSDPRAPEIVGQFMAAAPQWLVIRQPTTTGSFPRLGAGEAAAISLALELSADLLLIDDRRARVVATNASLKIIGTLGILEAAHQKGLVDLNEAVRRLRETDFRLAEPLLSAALARAKRKE